MQPDFWHQRWQDNQIGFHQSEPTTLMFKHWPTLDIAAGSRVFVPLAGKSKDMLWLASQGLRVLGVELTQLAVEQFFDEHALVPTVSESRYGRHYRSDAIEVICGDAFGLDAEVLQDCTAVFDRAALIALPDEMRQRYIHDLYARLPAGCRGLLITLEYPQHEKAGPPFSVTEAEVHQRYGRDWDVTTLERRDILAQEPRFIEEGVSALDTVVYRLQRH